MPMRPLTYSAAVAATLVLATYIAWFTSDDPQFNPATFEAEPLQIQIAPFEEALTLAQFRNGLGEIVTILVVDYDGETVTGIDFADFGAARLEDPFQVLAQMDKADLLATKDQLKATVEISVERLLPTGPPGMRHIGIGTNFPEHAEEAMSDSVFVFPKFGTATPSRTSVAASPSDLMDYEIELCARFDRPISSLVDFDVAVKGFFLCGDFTDRIALLELADFDNLDSGYGFSDAKSGQGFFPTGPFLVVPDDWASFIADTRMMTEHNGQPRQDARGEEMILDFRGLAQKSLGDMSAPRFYFDGDFFKLTPEPYIASSTTLMSGTSEGVIFTTPRRHDYIEIFLAYLASGGPLSGKSLSDVGIPVFVENEVAGGHFLKPGDVVTYRSSTLGDIVVDIVLDDEGG